jgi:hypothetical protein
MRLLLDTNTLLWALTNSPRIVAVKGLLLANEAVAALEVYEYESGGELVSWLREHVDTVRFAQIIEKLKVQ